MLVVGRSEAGKRITAAGMAFQAERERLRAEEEARRNRPVYQPVSRPLGKCAQIIAEVAMEYGLTPGDIRADIRTRPTVWARHEVFYRCRVETAHSLPQIGRLVGGKDHTTVINGIRKHCLRNNLEYPAGI